MTSSTFGAGACCGGTIVEVERSIVFWPTERDETNLEVLATVGISGDAAIRLAIASLAAECAPVAWALATADATV